MNKMADLREMECKAKEIRKCLLKLATIQNIHIGGDLSITDMMTGLWQYKMKYNPKNPGWDKRDRFVLSKGHASAVTSFNQAAIGCFDAQKVYDEYATDEGMFSMHSCNLVNPFVDVSTGSLGHGLPIACGIAAALKLKGNLENRVYVVMGDGEQSEGSIWEAVMNAVHYKLGNLIAIVDNNHIGGDDWLDVSTSLGDISKKYKSFGWETMVIDGNDMHEVIKVLDHLPDPNYDKPTVIICNTVKGKGVPFMENAPRWHTGKITEEQRDEAINRLDEEFMLRWAV